MNQKTAKLNLTCRTCSTSFATVKEKNEHQFSLMHHIRLDQAKKGTVAHSCCLCSLHIGGLKNYVAHLDGKKHKANLAKHRTSGNKSIVKIKKDNKQGMLSTPKVTIHNKQNTTNSSQNRKVSSPKTKSNNTNSTSHSNIGNDPKPVPVSSQRNSNYDVNEKMQHWTEYNCNDYTSDDYEYIGGWNFNSMNYHNYPQFYFDGDNWGQQNYNNYWWDKQSSWCNKEWNGHPQESCGDFQHSNDVNSYRSTQNSYRNYNNSGSSISNDTYNSKETYNNKNPNRFRWNKSVDEKLPSSENLKHDESSVHYKNNQLTHTVKSKNKYYDEKLEKNKLSDTKYNVNPKVIIKKNFKNLRLSGTSVNMDYMGKKTKSSYFKHSDSSISTGNVNKPNNNISLSTKEQTLLKQKAKPVISKIKPKSKQNKLNLPEKNTKVPKVTSQKYMAKSNKQTPLYKHVEPSIAAETKNSKYSVYDKTNVTAGTKDLNVKMTIQDTMLESNKNENTEKNYSKQQQLNEIPDVLHSTKLYKLSQILEESKLEFCSFDKELINKLVNFPRTRKEQLQLGKWIQDHSRTKKKLTLPRFNLHMVPSQNMKNQPEDSSDFLHSVLSEVVNNLQEGVIDSILLAIRNAEGDILQNTAVSSKEEHCTTNSLQSFSIKTEQDKNHLPNLHSGQLSHAEKIQWLQNWITDGCKPQNANAHLSQGTEDSVNQNKETCVVQDTKDCFSHGAEVSRDQNTNIHSLKSSNFNKLYSPSEGLLAGGDIKDSAVSAQSDDRKASCKTVQNESSLQEMPINSINVKQEVLIESEDSASSIITVKYENDNNGANQVSMPPVCNLQNEKTSIPPDPEHQISDINNYTTASNPTPEFSAARKHRSRWNPTELFSDICGKVPLDSSRTDMSSENPNLSNIDPEHQISDIKNYTTASNSTSECSAARKRRSRWNPPELFSDICGKVPLDSSRTDMSSENPNLSNIVIKTELQDVYDDEAVKENKFFINQNTSTNCNETDSEKIVYNNKNDSIPSDDNIGDTSLDSMISMFGAGSLCKDNPSTTINHVKDMLSKNKILLQQITELLNSHMGHSDLTDLSDQKLIQEILAASQKEEELRLLGSKIDRIISYFFRFAQEWKDKRTQAFYEEMRLRTRRIQLLERLQGQLQKSQNSPNHSKAEANSSSHITVNSKPEVASLNQPSISGHHYANEILTHNKSMAFKFNSCSMPENGSEKIPGFTGEIPSHPTEENVLKQKNSCVDSTIKKNTRGRKRKPLSSNNSSPILSDPTSTQAANIVSNNETNPMKRARVEKSTISTEGVGSLKYPPRTLAEENPPRTLAEENERFWTEMETWLQDMERNSLPSEKQGHMKQDEPETERWTEHVPTVSAESSMKHTSGIDSSHQGSLLVKETAFAIDHLEAHKSSVLDIKVHDGYLYTCSSDTTAKKFDLEHPSNVVLFDGHQKTVTSLQIVDLGNNQVQVFTSSMDGHLRCFDNVSGHCLNEVKIGIPIVCMTEGWGKLYLGLPTGAIALYSIAAKKIINSFQCSKCCISCIATSSEGALKILCVASYDSAVTVWDASTGLLLRCLEGQAKPPCIVKISGTMVYTSTTKRTVLIHNLSSGKLQKVLNWPAAATGLHVTGNYIFSCSYGGMIRCYTKEEGMLHALYYGAGKSSVHCMYVYNDWIFTGNRHGLIEAFRFNPHCVIPCQFGKCYFRFGRLEDLKYHLRNCHFPKIDDKLQSCAWRGCNVQFTSNISNQEKEEHTLQHIKK